MPRPPSHGVRQAAVALGVVKPSRAATAPTLTARIRRRRKRLLRELETKPLETISRDLRKAVTDGTIIDEQSADWLLRVLDDPEVASADVLGVSKFRYWNGNRLDRQRDQLVELERMRIAKEAPSLHDYLAAKAQNGSANSEPPVSAPTATVPDPSATPAAAEAVQGSEDTSA